MYKKYQLKNGMKVILVESHKSPVLSIQMWVKTGSADEKKGEEGISHFIEHLVFKGSRRFKVGEIAATVEAAGGELNAYTSFDQTVFHVTISREYQHVGLEVISEMMGHPLFDENEINNEREVVIEEIKRSADSPHRQASRLLFSTVYKKHPYGTPVIGYSENIKTVTREKLTKYYRSRYTPKNMTLVVAGDFNAKELRKDIDRLFGGFPKTDLRVVKRVTVRPAKTGSVVVEKAPFAETIVHLAFPIPPAVHKDIAAIEVFALILGQGDSSRLNVKLRLQEHLVNYVGASVFTARDPGFLAISMSLSEENIKPALEALGKELVRAVTEPSTQDEVKKALTNLASEQFYHQETVDGLARTYGHFQDLFNNPGHFTKFINQASKLTGRDILRIGRKYLDTSGFSIVMMTPADRDKIEPLVQKWSKEFRAEIKKSKPMRSAKSGRSRKPVSFLIKRPSREAPQVEKWDLPNGITLITRPNFDTPVISLRCASLGGSRLETRETQGATELLSRVWIAGCGDLSEREVNQRIDEYAASLNAFGGRNSLGLSMTCLKPFFDDMAQLYFLALTDPQFEISAVNREIKAMQEHVKLRQDNPAQLCILEFMKGMFPGHPYGRDPYGDMKSIGRLNQTSVRHMFRNKSGLCLVASGAFDPKKLVKTVEERLGDLNPGPLELRKIPFQYPHEETRLFQQSEKQQSHIVIGHPGLSITDPDRYTLTVMQAILAGQGGRLFIELRDKASLAYTVAPLRMEGLEGGYFGAYIGCSPEKSETAFRMLREEFDKLRQTPVRDEEVTRAQRYLIGKHDIELQRNSNLTSGILFDFIYGLDHTETFRFAEKVRAVTPESIRDLASRIFATPPVISLVGPSAPW